MVLCRWGEGEEDCGANSLKGSGFFVVLYSSSSNLGAVSLVHTGAFPCRCIWLSNLGSEHIWVQAWSNSMACCNGLSLTLVFFWLSMCFCHLTGLIHWALVPRPCYKAMWLIPQQPTPSSSLVSCLAKFPSDCVFTMSIKALQNLNFRPFLHLVASCS